MPRQVRQPSATGIYHVMLRGINRQVIFEDDEDYTQFLRVLHALLERYDEYGFPLPPRCTIYAYCMMSNHVHLLIREREEAIGESIKRIGVAYARYYNKKYERSGHLFQDRFRSEPVNTIEYFMTLMRYIHQNPVKAGIVKEVKNYPWSSWSEYEGRHSLICDTSPVIRRLNRQNLYEFVTMPVNDDNILDIDYREGGVLTDEEVRSRLAELSGITIPTEIQHMDKEKRNRLLKSLCEYGANIRQISRITGVSYGVIYRAKVDQ